MTVGIPTNLGDDYTVLIRKSHFKQLQTGLPIRYRLRTDAKGSQTVRFDADALGAEQVKEARIQLCPCFEGEAYSITVRNDFGWASAPRTPPRRTNYRLASEYGPKTKLYPSSLNTGIAMCKQVFRALRLDSLAPTDAHGFVVVSGSTKSFKSNIARGLIHLYLQRLMRDWLKDYGDADSDERRKQIRRPHLVTCEDDIEKRLFALDKLESSEDVYGIAGKGYKGKWLTNLLLPDYTPRTCRNDGDCGSLCDGVDDALRMTPAVFYAGEIRKPDDWKELYRLAQSHVVVVTTHASSLVNTFGNLQRCLDVGDSPQRRSELASSILGIVHMRSTQLDIGKKTWNTFLPTVWRRTPLALSLCTSIGLASIEAQHTGPDASSDRVFCLGRRWFAERQWEQAKSEAKPENRPDFGLNAPSTSDAWNGFVQMALNWDLRGE